MAIGINISNFLLLLLTVHSTWSQNEQNALRLHIPMWDITDIYSRLSNVFQQAQPTTAAPQQQVDPLAEYYKNFWQSVENKKQQLGLWSEDSASPGQVIPVPPPLPPPPLRPLRPLRPNRPRPRPTRPWPTRRPTRRRTTTRRTTTTTTAATTTTTTTTTTAKPTTVTTTTTTTAKPTTTTTTTTATPTKTESTSTESTSTNSTPVSTTTTPGSSTTGTVVVSSRSTVSPYYSTGSTTSNPICDLFPHLPICTSATSSLSSFYYPKQSSTIETPTVLSEPDPYTSQLHPERQLHIQSQPYSMTSLCYNYPRLCAHPEEAQYLRLSDGNGRPMLLIVPDRMSNNNNNNKNTHSMIARTTQRSVTNNNVKWDSYRPTRRPAWQNAQSQKQQQQQQQQRKHNYLYKVNKWKL